MTNYGSIGSKGKEKMIATVLSEWATLVIAIATLVSALVSAVQGRRNNGSIESVHALVNDRSSKQDNRIDQLTQTITDSPNIIVPPREPNGR